MKPGNSRKKVANSLVAMSSAAVMAVYAAGYTRTRAAAQRLDAQSEERRPAAPRPAAPIAIPGETAPAAAPVETSELKRLAPVAHEAPPATSVPQMEAATNPSPASEPVPAPPPVTAPAPAPNPPAQPVVAAIAPPAAPVAPLPPPNAPQWKDGTFLGWGTSRHGDIQASVVVEGGHIQSATIAQCLTRYSCSVIERLPPEVAQRQSPEVDYVSGATQSTNAFYYAVVDALSKAK